MLTILLWLKKLRQVLKLLDLKLMTESDLVSITIFLVKVTLKIGQEKYLLPILFWRLILTDVIKDLNGEKIIISFYENELFKSIL